ncbi:MAG: hypothetical protein K2X72_38375 [Reyranella sp.]|nr:hypothetical protein [Reyranella sp.]
MALCTNQPEPARGALSHAELDKVHDALRQMLAARGAKVDLILCCESERKCPRVKLAGGMLREALARYGAVAVTCPDSSDHG